MTKRSLPPALLIETDTALRDLAAQLQAEPLLAVDTESNSLYAYREQVCLIQISTRQADYIIDPLVIGDLEPLAPLMADPKIEKVFHAAEYDLMCLKRDFGFQFRNLFDTMVAARICGAKAFGLGALLAEHMGVEMDKSHQRDDWGQRPLPAEGLLYAQMDTHYLPDLRDYFHEQLTRLNRWEEAREAFDDLCAVVPVSSEFDPNGYWRMGTPHDLSRREMAVLRELYLLRESIARQRNSPPFKVFGDKTLVLIAQIMPSKSIDLDGIEGMTPAQVRRYGRVILEAVRRGQRSRPPAPPSSEPPTDPVVLERFTALREWRKNRAIERGVESDVIISKDTLWALAQRAPMQLDEMQNIPGLGPWRLSAYGEEILAVMRKFRTSG